MELMLKMKSIVYSVFLFIYFNNMLSDYNQVLTSCKGEKWFSHETKLSIYVLVMCE